MEGNCHATETDDFAMKTKTHFVDNFHHFPGPLPFPDQMPVIEQRCRAPTVTMHSDDLLKVLVARVEFLTFFIVRINAVFAHQQDAVDSQVIAAQCQCLGDGRIEAEPGRVPGLSYSVTQ